MKSIIATSSLLAIGLWIVNALESSNSAQIKAVLVAGSNGYDNYRHQADVCHAYQILIKNGIPKENIIVMMYDDIANNTENPDPGVIINRPNGPDVYGGVQIDYSGSNVNKANFFHVLEGNKEALKGIGSSRVLESGPQDNVFINFVDHGGPGILLMPEEEIAASDFIAVLENMHSNSRYAKLFLYIEACESGSMFDNLLPDNLNIFVITAADPHESSYACFYDEKRQTYLGDVFSVNWMKVSETDDLSTESVNHQFQEVRTSTNTSHVEEYGDIDIGNTKVSEVIGFRKTPLKNYSLNFKDAVSNIHVPVAILGQKIMRAKQTEEKNKLQEELHNLLQGRKKIESVFISLLHEITAALNIPHLFEKFLIKRPSLTKSSIGCYENMTKYISKQCFSISNNRYVASRKVQQQIRTIITMTKKMEEAGTPTSRTRTRKIPTLPLAMLRPLQVGVLRKTPGLLWTIFTMQETTLTKSLKNENVNKNKLRKTPGLLWTIFTMQETTLTNSLKNENVNNNKAKSSSSLLQFFVV